ncbi:uncharacterized protein PpBr36_10315 [Pyricularia pennisetigena]|uniref:uncharacterized protein n=1 Tax=Pyricularia pennisetigena TaxID=1578925 RepID=UPI00114DAC5D|nr:uncharacterized protein PpBr36_10315 [Pyricularia pennisetigena]TLS21447.1 hypothetical protein PpBr36_10315 [Pyricularia pennisetigena]
MFDIAYQPAKIPQVPIEPSNMLQSYHPTLFKRAMIDNTCTDEQRAVIARAAANCRTLAQFGASAAKTDKERVLKYFKTSNPRSISTIVKTYENAYRECDISRGENIITCHDGIHGCDDEISDYRVSYTIAHTHANQNKITICPFFFQLPATASIYKERSQANALLHEVTHLRSVKGTEDYSSRGHRDIMELTESQNLNHADTYAYFVEAARLKSPIVDVDDPKDPEDPMSCT